MTADRSAQKLAADVASGRRKAGDIIEDALGRLAAAERLGAVTRVYAERARAKAGRIDVARARGEKLGPLAGVPFAAKDLFDVQGFATGAGSHITAGNPPAAEDADALASLETAGAILIASTAMDELAYGFAGDSERDGAVINPRATGPAGEPLSTGGSSSGSAALVAAGVVPIALGSDTNGSVRVPAALCGIAGLKPTYGRLSRGGVYPFVGSLDHVGPLAAHVGDLALAYDALQGWSPRDPVQSARETEPVAETSPTAPMPRARRLAGYFSAPLHGDIADAVDSACATLGASQSAELALAEAGRAAAFVITNAEGGQRHLDALIAHPERFGPMVRDRLRAGALAPAIWVARAQQLRRRLSRQLADLLVQTDVLIAPATPFPAFPIGAETVTVEGQSLTTRLDVGRFTQALTLTGVPIAVVTKTGERSGLPVGVQIIGRAFREDQVLAAAGRLQAAGFRVGPANQAP